MNSFLTRTVTGVSLVLVMIVSMLLHPVSFAIITVAISAGVLWEIAPLVFQDRVATARVKIYLLALPVLLLAPPVAAGILPLKFFSLELLPLIIVVVSEMYTARKGFFAEAAKLIMAAVYGSLPFILFLFSSFSPGGPSTILDHQYSGFSPAFVLAFFALLWINDTGAYISGITMGRRKLFERISPKKTWEGFAGGTIMTIAAAAGAAALFDFLSPPMWIAMAVVVSVAATLGDLFESAIKRDAGVKDSGSILPGHGGFMDRFDGVSFAFPLVWLLITFFG